MTIQENKKNKSKKIESAICILRKSLNESWLYFCIAVELYSEYISKNTPNPNIFLDGSFDACIRASILTLAEIISYDKNSVNLSYLLNLAKNSAHSFPHVEEKDLLSSIENYFYWLKSLKSKGFSDNMFAKRNKMLAHTDRKFVTEIKSDFIKDNPSLNSDEVQEVYSKIHRIISDFEIYYFGTSADMGFKNINSEIKREIQLLMTTKRKNTS
jgi:hypothetical protein